MTKSPIARQNSNVSKGSSPKQNEQQHQLTGKFGDQNRPDEGFQDIMEHDQESADDDEYRESIDLMLLSNNNESPTADMFNQAYQYKESPNSGSGSRKKNPK